MTKPRIETGNREEVTVLCRLIGRLRHARTRHASGLTVLPMSPEGGSNLHLRLMYVPRQWVVKRRVAGKWKDSLSDPVHLSSATRDAGSASCAPSCHSVIARLPTGKTHPKSPSRRKTLSPPWSR